MNFKGWTSITFEYIYIPHLANKTSAAGYLDFKVILYGNNYSQPLDLGIEVVRPGKVRILFFKIMTLNLLLNYAVQIYLCDVPSIPKKMLSLFHDGLKESGIRMTIRPRTATANSGIHVAKFRVTCR